MDKDSISWTQRVFCSSIVVRNRAEFWTFFALPNFREPAIQKLYPFYHPSSFKVFYACFLNVFIIYGLRGASVWVRCRAETLRSRTKSLGWTSTESIVRVRSADDSRRSDVRVPNQISSVFEAFSCNRRDAHQSRRSPMQAVKRWRATYISSLGTAV